MCGVCGFVGDYSGDDLARINIQVNAFQRPERSARGSVILGHPAHADQGIRVHLRVRGMTVWMGC